MRRRIAFATGGAALAAAAVALVGPVGTANAVPITGPMDGVLVVQLTGPAGSSLAGIGIEADNEVSQAFTGTTDATGKVTLTGLNTSEDIYTIGITSVPDVGAGTLAPTVAVDHVPVTKAPTTFTIPLSVGGSITGLLVDHTGAPLPGKHVSANLPYTSYAIETATTDATGRYTVHGLEPGVVAVSVEADGAAGTGDWPVGAEWNALSVGGTTRTVPTVLVHTGYDLDVATTTLRTREPISGATIRARNTVTGATFDERTSYTIHWQQDVAFDIPSGTYTIEMITRATATHPVQEFWAGENGNYSPHASDAVPVTVTYGSDGLHEARIDALLGR